MNMESKVYLPSLSRRLSGEEFEKYKSEIKKIAFFDPEMKKWYIDYRKLASLDSQQLNETIENLKAYIGDISNLIERKDVTVKGNYITILNKNVIDKVKELTSFTVKMYNPDIYRYEDVTFLLSYEQDDGTISTWRGFLYRLKQAKIINVEDNFYENFDTNPVPLENYEARDYQINAVREWLKAVNLQGTGLIQSPTGTGKSVMAVMAIKSFLKKYPYERIIYLSLNTTLLKQFQDFLQKEGLDSGIVAEGRREFDAQILNVSVMTMYTALRRANQHVEKVTQDEIDEDIVLDSEDLTERESVDLMLLLKHTKLIIVDEAHHVPASSIRAIIRNAPDSIRLGLTATPWRDKGDDMIIYSLLGDPVVRYRLMDFVKKGVLTPPSVKLTVLGEYKQFSNYQEEKQYQFDDDENYDKIVSIIEKAEKPILVLVREKIQLEKLKERLGKNAEYLTGVDDLDKRYDIIEQFNKGLVKILVATPIFDEGIDIPNIKSLVLLTQGKSKVKYLQRIGRSLRKSKGKEKVIIYDIVFNSNYFTDHMGERQKVLEEEKIPYEIISV
jgi:superfamily II DNA or RNA helicase